MAGWREGLKKVGAYWQYRFSYRGSLHTGSTKCTTLADARGWLAAFKSRLARGEVGQFDVPTVGRACSDWLQLKEGFCSKANLVRARGAFGHILPEIGSMKADQVRTEHVVKIVQTYLKGISPSGRTRTVDGANVVLLYLKAVYNHLVANGYLAKIPFKVKKLKAQVKPRAVLPLDMVEAFLAILDSKANPHIGTAARAMVYMGLRESEALGMRWEWIDPSGEKYTPGKTKGKEADALPMPPDLWARIKHLRRESGWVLPGEGDAPHFPQFTRKAIRAAGAEVGVHGLTPHRLRATFATLLSRTGSSVYEVQKLLRHKQLSTTLHYVQTHEQELQEASQRLWERTHQGAQPLPSDPSRQDETQVTANLREAPSSVERISTRIIEFEPMPRAEVDGTTQGGAKGAAMDVLPLNSPVA